MQLRGAWAAPHDYIIIEASPSSFASLGSINSVQAVLGARNPAKIIFLATNEPELIKDPDDVVRRSLRRQGKLRVEHWLGFVGPPGTFKQCALSRLQNCGDLTGKTLFITELAEEPLRTPLGVMSRGEILAGDQYSTLKHREILYASPLIQALIVLLSILIAAFYVIYYPVLLSAIAVTGTGIAVVIILLQVVFQIFSIYVPSFGIGGSLLVTYLVFTGYRLAFQENTQWQSLKQSQYLGELDQMKTNFLSLVSHDLKTPLAKIQAVSERMRRELSLPLEGRSDWKEMLDSIDNSNNELKHYISSILNLSKIESKKVILNKKSNDINLLIQQTIKRLKSVSAQKNIEIREQLEPLFSVECDEDLIRQILTNIIDNAIKYSPPHSYIIVRSREVEGSVCVEVEDFGPGIPKDQLPLMFRKFNRFLRPIQEKVKGTGLGLYLSKYFVELHGGDIVVKSIEGQGTVFTFTLPLNGIKSSE